MDWGGDRGILSIFLPTDGTEKLDFDSNLYGDDLKKLMFDLLHSVPNKRPSAKEVLEITKNVDKTASPNDLPFQTERCVIPRLFQKIDL